LNALGVSLPISPPQKSYVTRAILILSGLNLLDYVDRYVIAALASPIKLELGLSDRAFGLLGTAFFLVYLLSSPVFGYLGDRWGRIRLMAAGAMLWSLATSLAAWVSTYYGLLLARGLVGLGEASFGTLAPAYLADVLPITRRARYLGLFYATIPVGAALAYYFGGQLGYYWGWRWAFMLAGLPGLGLGLLIFTLPKQTAPAAPASEAFQTGGLRQPLLVAGELWKIPTFRRVTLGYGLLTFALGGLAFWMPRFLELHKGLSFKEANLLMALATTIAGGLGTLVGGLGGDWLFARSRRAHLWVGGLGVLTALPFGALAIFATQPLFYGVGLFAACFLLFLNPGVLTTVIVSVAGATRRATALALNIIIIHLVGDVPSPFLIGWVSDLAGLQYGVSLALVALAGSAMLLLSGIAVVSPDLARAGE